MTTAAPDQIEIEPKEEISSSEHHSNSSLWREKAETFLFQSSSRFKFAATKVTEAAEEAGLVVKNKWKSTKDGWNTAVQPRVESSLGTAAHVAAETTSKIKKAILDTTGSVQPRVESSLEAAKKLASETRSRIQRGFETSRNNFSMSNGSNANRGWRFGIGLDKTNHKRNAILERIDSHRKPGSANLVFGLPLEIVIERQENKKVVYIVERCVEYLIDHEGDIDYQTIFSTEGNQESVMRLIRLFDNNPKATIPLNSNCFDISNLLVTYVKCLPEPLLTFDLYDALVLESKIDFEIWKTLLSRIPIINLFTLKCIISLLSFITIKSENKVKPEDLALVWAPLLIWRKGMPTIASQKHIEESEEKENAEKENEDEEKEGADGKKETSLVENLDTDDHEIKKAERDDAADTKPNHVDDPQVQIVDKTHANDEEHEKLNGDESPEQGAWAPCYAAPGEKLKTFFSFGENSSHGVELDEEKELSILTSAISCLIENQEKIFVDLIPKPH